MEMLLQKAKFVSEFGELVKKADPDIADLTYKVNTNSGTETVEIKYKGGLIRRVDVTADSLMAIVKDLVKAWR